MKAKTNMGHNNLKTGTAAENALGKKAASETTASEVG